MERELWKMKILYRLVQALGKRWGEWLFSTPDILISGARWLFLHEPHKLALA
jgi:hypothetical protein